MRKLNAYWKKGDLGSIQDASHDLGVKARTVMALNHMLEKRKYKEDFRMIQWIVCGDPVSRKEIHSLAKAEA